MRRYGGPEVLRFETVPLASLSAGRNPAAQHRIGHQSFRSRNQGRQLAGSGSRPFSLHAWPGSRGRGGGSWFRGVGLPRRRPRHHHDARTGRRTRAPARRVRRICRRRCERRRAAGGGHRPAGNGGPGACRRDGVRRPAKNRRSCQPPHRRLRRRGRGRLGRRCDCESPRRGKSSASSPAPSMPTMCVRSALPKR